MVSEVPNRRLSTALTLTVLVALLVVGALVGLKTMFAPLPGDNDVDTTTPVGSCTPTKVGKGKRLDATDVKVSVYNAGDRAGLATETLDALVDRGFQLGEAGNAPDGTEVSFVQVWTEKKDASARLVALQFGQRTLIRKADDLGPGVDVVVGSGFKGLVEAPTSIKAGKAETACIPDS